MSRPLPSWAVSAPRQRERSSVVADLMFVARSWPRRIGKQQPSGVPEAAGTPLRRRRFAHRAGTSLWLLRRRLMVDLSGLDEVAGIEPPVVVAANHPSALDLPVLKAALPRTWRAVARDPEPALAAGRSVIIFPEGEASSDGRLRPFSDAAAELARNHNVPLVPVAIKGTFQLKTLLRLRSLRRRPKIAVRIARPIPPRLLSVPETTARLEEVLTDLLAEEDLTWWELQRQRQRPSAPETQDMAAWRRVWGQWEPQPATRRSRLERIWPDPKATRGKQRR
ncbi:MAG: lysophospholipid acyltransferase family protein [Propionibacteriaceae bacterium]|nr:lysophospholipid acyltransferase family protein [Propionibacteriaceae bacterium]